MHILYNTHVVLNLYDYVEHEGTLKNIGNQKWFPMTSIVFFDHTIEFKRTKLLFELPIYIIFSRQKKESDTGLEKYTEF